MELEQFNPDGLSLLACVKTEQSAFDEAVEIGRKAILLTPRHSPNLAVYAIALLRAGAYQAAVQEIKKAIRLSPFSPAWYLHVLGSSSFTIGEYDHWRQFRWKDSEVRERAAKIWNEIVPSYVFNRQASGIWIEGDIRKGNVVDKGLNTY